ncbi:MAG: hypothetical protein GC159_21995 [Phycisphaera sp.]|nr:hypothetical protein [Phycisphaera sp.]
MTSIHRTRAIAALLIAAFAACTVTPRALHAADTPPGKVFRAGAYAQDITPQKFPITVNGGMRDHFATSAHDPLHARCIVLDDGSTQIAFAICDACMIPREIHDAAKAIASKATGIPTSHILISATHTHSAPTSTGVFQSDPDNDYREFLTQQIAAGIIQAYKQLEPAKIGWAIGLDPTQVFNRRWLLRGDSVLADPFGRDRDRVKMNPGFGRRDLMRPAGLTDAEVPVVALRAVDGDRPIALLANYSLHYVGGVPGDQLSADYYGAFARKMTERVDHAADAKPAFVAAMSNGTSGDINNIDFSKQRVTGRKPYEQIDIVADSVADAAMMAYARIDWHDWVPLKIAQRELTLGVRKPDAAELAAAKATVDEAHKRDPVLKTLPEIYARESVLIAAYPDTVDLKLQAIRLGDLGVCAIPCETFVATGLELKARSPLKPTFTIELANGYNGYLPTPDQHALGGYETWRARSSYLEEQASVKITQTLLELLDEVAK